jgi:hypothetical protein
MTENGKQIQKSGDDSINIQAGQISIVRGLSVEDVKSIALDVFKSNFYELSGIAKDTAKERAEEITNKFLAELMSRNPDGLQSAEDPDVQYAIFTAQREYARTGDKELGDILVDILVDRTKESNRSVLQIVLNESLQVAPKLTKNQLDALSIIFSLRYTRYLKMSNLDALKHYLDYRLSPFIPSLTKNDTCYQHLAYAGCGTISIGSVEIEAIFLKHYTGLFVKGFPESDIASIVESNPSSSTMFMKCIRNPSLLQVNGIDEETIRTKSKKIGLDDLLTKSLIQIQNQNIMTEEEIKSDLKTIHPCMEKLFDVWDGSFMKNINLTSVGIAIGHANTRRITKETDNLSIWIN